MDIYVYVQVILSSKYFFNLNNLDPQISRRFLSVKINEVWLYVKSVESSIMYTYFFFKKLNLTISILTIKNTIHTQFTILSTNTKKKPQPILLKIYFSIIYMSYKNKTKYNIEDVFLCVYKSITNKLELFVYKEKHCRLPKL